MGPLNITMMKVSSLCFLTACLFSERASAASDPECSSFSKQMELVKKVKAKKGTDAVIKLLLEGKAKVQAAAAAWGGSSRHYTIECETSSYCPRLTDTVHQLIPKSTRTGLPRGSGADYASYHCTPEPLIILKVRQWPLAAPELNMYVSLTGRPEDFRSYNAVKLGQNFENFEGKHTMTCSWDTVPHTVNITISRA